MQVSNYIGIFKNADFGDDWEVKKFWNIFMASQCYINFIKKIVSNCVHSEGLEMMLKPRAIACLLFRFESVIYFYIGRNQDWVEK